MATHTALSYTKRKLRKSKARESALPTILNRARKRITIFPFSSLVLGLEFLFWVWGFGVFPFPFCLRHTKETFTLLEPLALLEPLVFLHWLWISYGPGIFFFKPFNAAPLLCYPTAHGTIMLLSYGSSFSLGNSKRCWLLAAGCCLGAGS